MDQYEKRQLINRLLSGYVFLNNYIVDIPSSQILAEADYIYDKFVYDNRFESLINESQTDFLLMKSGLWDREDEAALKLLPNKIENSKISLYKNCTNPKMVIKIRRGLKSLKRQYDTLMTRKSAFDQYTLEFNADYVRDHFIFSKTILDRNYNNASLSGYYIDKIIGQFKKNTSSVIDYRELARDDEWHNIWVSGNNSIFRAIGIEQRTIISFTNMYENIGKHPEVPSEEIIADNDMVDGWMILLRREANAEKKEKDFENTGKIQKDKGNEHFIMVEPGNQEDIEAVQGMNDLRGKVIQKKLFGMIDKHGKANEYDIQEIRQDANIKQLGGIK